MQFRHLMAKDVHAPGFYVNSQPGENYMGGGLWRSESKIAYRIRAYIDENPVEWKKVSRGKRFTDVFTVTGDSLIRPPRGYDADHPLIDDLKREDFIASVKLTQKDVTSPEFMDLFIGNLKRAMSHMRFLCEAVGVPF